MDIVLTPIEIRVLGSLAEKEFTTQDSYPLSLNALTTACNQKTNREPVMELSENTVLEAVETLSKKTLVTRKSSASSRVEKYAHRLSNRLRDEYNFAPPELAVLCVLLLRGPQTVGEIRTRTQRMHGFADVLALENTLTRLAEREDGPFVVRLERQPGQKEVRYAHLFAGEEALAKQAVLMADNNDVVIDDETARIAELELKVLQLSQELNEVKQRLESFIKQFE